MNIRSFIILYRLSISFDLSYRSPGNMPIQQSPLVLLSDGVVSNNDRIASSADDERIESPEITILIIEPEDNSRLVVVAEMSSAV